MKSPASESGDEAPRGALLSSIQGFKGGLKKVSTNDRSTPTVKGGDEKEKGVAPSRGGGMMADILNARSKIVSAPVKKDMPSNPSKQSLHPPPMKQTGTSPSNANLRSGSGSANIPKPSPALIQEKEKEKETPSYSSGVSNAEMQALKEEILVEMRKELQAMKEEILAAILNR